MNQFKKLFGKYRFIEQELKFIENQKFDDYFQFIDNINSTQRTEINRNNEKNEKNHNFKEEEEDDELGDNQFQINIGSNTQSRPDKNIDYINENTITQTKNTSNKSLGRKKLMFTGTGVHGADSKDNQRDKAIRNLIDFIRNKCNLQCKKYGELQETNLIQQFGSNNSQKLNFVKTKFYKIFCYNTIYEDNKKHRDKASKNEAIIRKMIEEKNELFIALMKSSLNDYEKIVELISAHFNLEENDEMLDDFKNKAQNLITYLELEGKKNKRKNIIEKTINYIIIKELEEN